MDERRRRILLVAYSCRPGLTSEREVGWKWASLLAERHDVWVLTRETNRPYIEAWAAEQGPVLSPSYIYYDLPAWARAWKRGERGLVLYYVLWSLFAMRKARRVHRAHPFEITHFLTFGTLLWPQFAFMMNTKYVLGPVGGGERVPAALMRAFGVKDRMKLLARRTVQLTLYVNPFFWVNLALADKILARTRETFDLVPKAMHHKTELFLETAVSHVLAAGAKHRDSGGQLVIVTVGRLITTKVSRLTLEAIQQFKRAYGRPFTFLVIGDGPQRAHLEAVAQELGLEEVRFTGWCTGPEVLEHLNSGHIYFSTTMKEGGSWAFFEAIVCHLPIVCLKVNGPDMIVGDGCGIKVAPTNYDDARQHLSDGLLRLARSERERTELSERALAYLLQNFTWEKVLERMNRIYEEVNPPLKEEAGGPRR